MGGVFSTINVRVEYRDGQYVKIKTSTHEHFADETNVFINEVLGMINVTFRDFIAHPYAFYYYGNNLKVAARIRAGRLLKTAATMTITLNDHTSVTIEHEDTTYIYVKTDGYNVGFFHAKEYVYAEAMMSQMVIANNLYRGTKNLTITQMYDFISSSISNRFIGDDELQYDENYQDPAHPKTRGSLYIPQTSDAVRITSGTYSSTSSYVTNIDAKTTVHRQFVDDTVIYVVID